MNFSKQLSSILFLLILAFTQLQGDEAQIDPNSYRRYAELLEYTTNSNFEILATVTLSDGTKWKMFLAPDEEEILFHLEKSMEPNKEVFLDVAAGTRYFRMIGCVDDTQCYSFKVAMDKQTPAMKDSFPYFVKEKEIVVSEGGWFTKPKYAYLIYLSDNSIWRSEDKCYWNAGDPIIVSHAFSGTDELSWNHINLNRPFVYEYNNSTYDLRIQRSLKLENSL